MNEKQVRWFNISTSLYFANTTTNIAANSLKLNVQVKNWLFSSLKNELNLIFDAKDVGNNVDRCNVDAQSDSSDNLYSYVISIDGTSLYPLILLINFPFPFLSLSFYFLMFCFDGAKIWAIFGPSNCGRKIQSN